MLTDCSSDCGYSEQEGARGCERRISSTLVLTSIVCTNLFDQNAISGVFE